MNTRLINVEVLPQQMGDGFEELMDEAYRQQRIALAAPDLLAALEQIATIEFPGERNIRGTAEDAFMKNMADIARAAIAKARGEA